MQFKFTGMHLTTFNTPIQEMSFYVVVMPVLKIDPVEPKCGLPEIMTPR